MALPRVVLISLGGTITMTRSESGGITPTLTADDLVRAAPGIEQVASLETLSPMRLPGASLTLQQLRDVAALIDERLAGGADGAVVIQGTDTIEETAFVLDLLVKSDKPVVVTGAMRGAEAPGADGPANVLAATTVAGSAEAVGLGSLVVLNDEVHAARFVQKSHTALPSAFTSPAAGPLGHVIEGRLLLHTRVTRTRLIEITKPDAEAQVALVKIGLGDDDRLLRALPGLGYRGVVIEGMGVGHVPAVLVPAIAELAAVMPVVLSVRVHAGPSFTNTYGFPGSEIDLLGRGVLSSGMLNGLQARLLLSLLLCSVEPAQVAEAFKGYTGSR